MISRLTISRLPLRISGTTSAQYFVQATTRPNSPTLARMTVALGCRQAIRRGWYERGSCDSDMRPIVGSIRRECEILRLAHYNRSVYSAELLDHFQNPRNAGEIKDPDSVAQLENPACGDILELSLRLEKHRLEKHKLEKPKPEAKRIADIRFRAKGCVPAMACGSAITELVKGRSVEEARQLSREELVQKVGGLPQASTHASHLAMDTLAALLRNL